MVCILWTSPISMWSLDKPYWYVVLDKPCWYVVFGQAMEGSLWTSHGVWSLDKPWYVVFRQAMVGSLWKLWTSCGMHSLDKLWYMVLGKAMECGLQISCGTWPVGLLYYFYLVWKQALLHLLDGMQIMLKVCSIQLFKLWISFAIHLQATHAGFMLE